jgi:hypothetical protein
MEQEMINTEYGRLDELIEVVAADRNFVLEAMGCGPSGAKSRDKTLCADDPRFDKFSKRAKDLTDILQILWSLKT